MRIRSPYAGLDGDRVLIRPAEPADYRACTPSSTTGGAGGRWRRCCRSSSSSTSATRRSSPRTPTVRSRVLCGFRSQTFADEASSTSSASIRHCRAAGLGRALVDRRRDGTHHGSLRHRGEEPLVERATETGRPPRRIDADEVDVRLVGGTSASGSRTETRRATRRRRRRRTTYRGSGRRRASAASRPSAFRPTSRR